MNLGAKTPFSAALVAGRPQTKTNTVRMTQGVQALTTAARGCTVGLTAGLASPPSCSWPRRDTEVQMRRGCHTRRKPTSATIEHIAAITSTSSGPMKLLTRYCGIAKDRPVTRMAGQISHIALRPAKAQISQNGTSSEKKGSWRPIMPDTAIRS